MGLREGSSNCNGGWGGTLQTLLGPDPLLGAPKSTVFVGSPFCPLPPLKKFVCPQTTRSHAKSPLKVENLGFPQSSVSTTASPNDRFTPSFCLGRPKHNHNLSGIVSRDAAAIRIRIRIVRCQRPAKRQKHKRCETQAYFSSPTFSLLVVRNWS